MKKFLKTPKKENLEEMVGVLDKMIIEKLPEDHIPDMSVIVKKINEIIEQL
jgi:hypothetical protein